MLDHECIAADLQRQGYSVLPACLETAAVNALRAELAAQPLAFRAAGIGRGDARQRDATIRSDDIRWLDGSQPAQAAFLQRMDVLREALNRRLLLGLFDCEAHFARYAPGAFYRRHRDTFAAIDRQPRRVLSMVVYLNADWHADDGGELVLYGADDTELARVLPEAGTAVIFLSEEFPHEVLPARRERHSIAGWFRTRGV